MIPHTTTHHALIDRGDLRRRLTTVCKRRAVESGFMQKVAPILRSIEKSYASERGSYTPFRVSIAFESCGPLIKVYRELKVSTPLPMVLFRRFETGLFQTPVPRASLISLQKFGLRSRTKCDLIPFAASESRRHVKRFHKKETVCRQAIGANQQAAS